MQSFLFHVDVGYSGEAECSAAVAVVRVFSVLCGLTVPDAAESLSHTSTTLSSADTMNTSFPICSNNTTRRNPGSWVDSVTWARKRREKPATVKTWTEVVNSPQKHSHFFTTTLTSSVSVFRFSTIALGEKRLQVQSVVVAQSVVKFINTQGNKVELDHLLSLRHKINVAALGKIPAMRSWNLHGKFLCFQSISVTSGRKCPLITPSPRNQVSIPLNVSAVAVQLYRNVVARIQGCLKMATMHIFTTTARWRCESEVNALRCLCLWVTYRE